MEPQRSVDHQIETQSESPSKPFTVETDTSDFAFGYSLLQKGDDGIMHPVAFEGRKMKPVETRHPTDEKELLAIKEAFNKWNHYIQNNHTTTVLTDHESLRYMNTVSIYDHEEFRKISSLITDFHEILQCVNASPGTPSFMSWWMVYCIVRLPEWNFPYRIPIRCSEGTSWRS